MNRFIESYGLRRVLIRVGRYEQLGYQMDRLKETNDLEKVPNDPIYNNYDLVAKGLRHLPEITLHIFPGPIGFPNGPICYQTFLFFFLPSYIYFFFYSSTDSQWYISSYQLARIVSFDLAAEEKFEKFCTKSVLGAQYAFQSHR